MTGGERLGNTSFHDESGTGKGLQQRTTTKRIYGTSFFLVHRFFQRCVILIFVWFLILRTKRTKDE